MNSPKLLLDSHIFSEKVVYIQLSSLQKRLNSGFIEDKICLMPKMVYLLKMTRGINKSFVILKILKLDSLCQFQTTHSNLTEIQQKNHIITAQISGLKSINCTFMDTPGLKRPALLPEFEMQPRIIKHLTHVLKVIPHAQRYPVQSIQISNTLILFPYQLLSIRNKPSRHDRSNGAYCLNPRRSALRPNPLPGKISARSYPANKRRQEKNASYSVAKNYPRKPVKLHDPLLAIRCGERLPYRPPQVYLSLEERDSKTFKSRQMGAAGIQKELVTPSPSSSSPSAPARPTTVRCTAPTQHMRLLTKHRKSEPAPEIMWCISLGGDE